MGKEGGKGKGGKEEKIVDEKGCEKDREGRREMEGGEEEKMSRKGGSEKRRERGNEEKAE